MSVTTGEDGSFAFTNLESEMEYRVALEIPADQTLVLPTLEQSGIWNVYLPAGETITDRDFGLRPASTIGQFENAIISGTLFEDRNGDRTRNHQEPGIGGVSIFLDLNDDGTRQFDDPITTTDKDGSYSFSGLGNRSYTVRVMDVLGHQQTSPVGNEFARLEYSLAVPGSPLGSPQDVASADFNGDSWPDLATAVFDRNSISILLNDGHGGFQLPAIEISLAPANRPLESRGIGPVALLAGDFNGAGGTDLAVANALSSKIAVLLDFNGTGFASEQFVPSGALPSGISAGDLDGDADLDLIVTNDLAAGNKNLAILRNDGRGRFSADSSGPVSGNHPFAVSTGFFNGDTLLDFAVANFGTHPDGGDLGGAHVFLAKSDGGYESSVACDVGFGPSATTSSDLDGDGNLDLAIANFLSDNITLCQGNGDGTFANVATLPGGSGPMDITAEDIDKDGDLDLLITNGKSQKVAILRNDSEPGVFEFQPAETFGAVPIPGATRISLATADVDKNGLVDVVVVNHRENRALVNANSLVGGAHRVALAGVETIQGLNFGFKPVNTPPTLDPIPNPPAVNEDQFESIIVPLTGVSDDRSEHPLRWLVTSHPANAFKESRIDYSSSDNTGTLTLEPREHLFGDVRVTVTVFDSGLDNVSDTLDDASVSQMFVLTIRPVNDTPVAVHDSFRVPSGATDFVLDVLNNDNAANPDPDEGLIVFLVTLFSELGTARPTDDGDAILISLAPFASGTHAFEYRVHDGELSATGSVTITIVNGPLIDAHNENAPWDVNDDGTVVAHDALLVINELNNRMVTNPQGLIIAQPLADAPYPDVDNDGHVLSLDALLIINYLNNSVSAAAAVRATSPKDQMESFRQHIELQRLDMKLNRRRSQAVTKLSSPKSFDDDVVQAIGAIRILQGKNASQLPAEFNFELETADPYAHSFDKWPNALPLKENEAAQEDWQKSVDEFSLSIAEQMDRWNANGLPLEIGDELDF